MKMTLTSCPHRKEAILKQEAAGTVVLLSLDSGLYYSMNEVGGRTWDLCDGKRSLSEIARVLEGEYDAPAETIEGDVIELINDLAYERLVE